MDLETILQAEVFVNEGDLQVRAAHKILGYDPIQKSFMAPKYVIKAKDPRFQKITVSEHDFFLLKGSSAQQAAETEEGGVEGESKSLNWTSPTTNLVHLTNSIRLRILLVT